jgi:hypothetical protein
VLRARAWRLADPICWIALDNPLGIAASLFVLPRLAFGLRPLLFRLAARLFVTGSNHAHYRIAGREASAIREAFIVKLGVTPRRFRFLLHRNDNPGRRDDGSADDRASTPERQCSPIKLKHRTPPQPIGWVVVPAPLCVEPASARAEGGGAPGAEAGHP